MGKRKLGKMIGKTGKKEKKAIENTGKTDEHEGKMMRKLMGTPGRLVKEMKTIIEKNLGNGTTKSVFVPQSLLYVGRDLFQVICFLKMATAEHPLK